MTRTTVADCNDHNACSSLVQLLSWMHGKPRQSSSCNDDSPFVHNHCPHHTNQPTAVLASSQLLEPCVGHDVQSGTMWVIPFAADAKATLVTLKVSMHGCALNRNEKSIGAAKETPGQGPANDPMHFSRALRTLFESGMLWRTSMSCGLQHSLQPHATPWTT